MNAPDSADLELAHRFATWLARDRATLHPRRKLLRAMAPAGAITRVTARSWRDIDGASPSALRSCRDQGLVRARTVKDGTMRYWLTTKGLEASQ